MERLNIPLLDLRAQDAEIGTEVRRAVESVLASQQFILGVAVAAFEREIAEYCGALHAVGVASGSDALCLALQALGVGPGTSIITSAYSFISSATAIARLGARPVFVDIDPKTFNLSVDAVRGVIEAMRRRDWPDRLMGVLPVHLFGATVPLAGIADLVIEHGLFIVEDAAQAIGSRIEGESSRRAGAVGDAGCLSFYPTKNLGGLGDGGMILTSRTDIADRVRSLRVHGAVGGPYRHEAIGLGSRLDALQAAALSVKLRHVDRWNEARRRVAGWYAESFASVGLGDDPARIELPEAAGAAHVFHQYVIRVPRYRDKLRAALDDRGIGTQIYYPIPLPLQPCLRSLGHHAGEFPQAELASTEVLALPMYPQLSRAAVNAVVSAIAELLDGWC